MRFLALGCGLLLLVFHSARAQVSNTGMTDREDSTELGKVQISGYVDTYYAFDFNAPSGGNRPYAVSSSRDREMNINLAYIDIRYNTDRIRARLVPGFGTYVNANYANEPGTLKNMIEAWAGVRLSAKRQIWLDAGVLGSPFTNESAISRDHLMYSRSMSAENVPYYLSGARLTAPIGKRFTGYLYLINGWQHIADPNQEPAGALQLEYRPTKDLLINGNCFLGNEKSATDSMFRNRSFLDLYVIYQPKGPISFTTSVYAGQQAILGQGNKSWSQANFIARYRFNHQWSLSGRIETFNDPSGLFQAIPVSNRLSKNGGRLNSTGLCLDMKIAGHALVRLEGRHYFSDEPYFESSNNKPLNQSTVLFTNLCIWF